LPIPKDPTRWRGNLKGLSYERGWLNQLTISAPLRLREIYQMIPLSAKQISLDSPFKLFLPNTTRPGSDLVRKLVELFEFKQ
jgi:hypothetical protein